MYNLTPWTQHEGIWFKREDLFAYGGVNGSKFRQCLHLFKFRRSDEQLVVTGASALSPQHAIVSTCARLHGMQSHHILAAHDPLKYPSTHIAYFNGAIFHPIKVGYQPAVTRAVMNLKEFFRQQTYYEPFYVPYGIGEDTPSRIRAFHEVGAHQTKNLPEKVQTLFVPAGSCNTLVSVILGLSKEPKGLRRLISIGVGPSKVTWVQLRLSFLGINRLPFEWDHSLSLHENGYASYSDKFPEQVGNLSLHPTYEGKVYRWLRTRDILRRDGSQGFWNVGSAPDPALVGIDMPKPEGIYELLAA